MGSPMVTSDLTLSDPERSNQDFDQLDCEFFLNILAHILAKYQHIATKLHRHIDVRLLLQTTKYDPDLIRIPDSMTLFVLFRTRF